MIIDLVGVSQKHKLITLNSLFGLPPKALTDGKQTAGAAVAEMEEEEAAEEARRSYAAGRSQRMRAAAVDLFSSTPLNWIASGPGYILSGGDTVYSIQPSFDDQWRLTAKRRDFEPVTLFDGSVSLCQGIAEDSARRAGVSVLVQRDAPWRSHPPTEAQLAALGRMRIAIPENATKGILSDLISERAAQRRR